MGICGKLKTIDPDPYATFEGDYENDVFQLLNDFGVGGEFGNDLQIQVEQILNRPLRRLQNQPKTIIDKTPSRLELSDEMGLINAICCKEGNLIVQETSGGVWTNFNCYENPSEKITLERNQLLENNV